jgi:hypothetical protein
MQAVFLSFMGTNMPPTSSAPSAASSAPSAASSAPSAASSAPSAASSSPSAASSSPSAASSSPSAAAAPLTAATGPTRADQALLDKIQAQQSTLLAAISPTKLIAYQTTQNSLHQTDVAVDAAYRRAYTGFYVLRLPDSGFYDGYFALLEQHKTNPAIDYATLLDALQQVTGRLEASFAAKMLATIRPELPPLDRIVLDHLNLALPAANPARAHERRAEVLRVYQALVTRMQALLQQPGFAAVIAAFRQHHPDYGFTDMKILDLVLWRLR